MPYPDITLPAPPTAITGAAAPTQLSSVTVSSVTGFTPAGDVRLDRFADELPLTTTSATLAFVDVVESVRLVCDDERAAVERSRRTLEFAKATERFRGILPRQSPQRRRGKVRPVVFGEGFPSRLRIPLRQRGDRFGSQIDRPPGTDGQFLASEHLQEIVALNPEAIPASLENQWQLPQVFRRGFAGELFPMTGPFVHRSGAEMPGQRFDRNFPRIGPLAHRFGGRHVNDRWLGRTREMLAGGSGECPCQCETSDRNQKGTKEFHGVRSSSASRILRASPPPYWGSLTLRSMPSTTVC